MQKLSLNLLILLILFSFSRYADATFHGLRDTYLKESLQLKQIELNQNISKFESEKYLGRYDWGMSFSYENEESFPAAFFQQFSQETTTDTFSLGFSKYFNSGTSFSIGQTVLSYDLTKWNSPPSPEPYEVKNMIEISQDLSKDFLGMNSREQDAVNKTKFNSQLLNLEYQKQENIYNFFIAYITAKKQNTVLAYTNKAIDRAIERVKIVERKYRDGLIQKVDNYQSKASLDAQKISTENAKSLFEKSLIELSQQFEDKTLTNQEIASYYFDKNLLTPINGTYEDNLNLRNMKELLRLTELNKEIASRSSRPDVNLKFSYVSNAIESSFSEARSNSGIGGDNDVRAISLNITYPFGNRVAKNDSEIASAKFMESKYKLQYLKNSLKLTSGFIQKNIIIAKNKIAFGKLSLLNSTKAYNEQNRLYRLGRTDFDQVIRSEEELIRSEIDLVNTLFDYESILAQDALLKGQVVEFVMSYND